MLFPLIFKFSIMLLHYFHSLKILINQGILGNHTSCFARIVSGACCLYTIINSGPFTPKMLYLVDKFFGHIRYRNVWRLVTCFLCYSKACEKAELKCLERVGRRWGGGLWCVHCFNWFFLEQFRFTAKLKGRYRDFPYTPCPHTHSLFYCQHAPPLQLNLY